MKKVFRFSLIVVCLTLISGCSKKSRISGMNVNFSSSAGKISVVCNTFPFYDWTREVLGDEKSFELKLIQKNGSDLHNFKASVQDLIDIRQSDLFIYGGGESDEWITESLFSDKTRVIKLIDIDFPYVMEEDEDEKDEHIWLSLKNAKIFIKVIAFALSEACPKGALDFEKNASAYIEKLKALDENFSTLFEESFAGGKVDFIICDRFPFAYFERDYGLSCFAAFNGCSAESEASFEKVAFLAEKLNRSKANFVFTLENSEKKLAQTVIFNSEKKDARIYELDSMQGVKISGEPEKLKNGGETDGEISYLSIMEKNYQTVKTALNAIK